MPAFGLSKATPVSIMRGPSHGPTIPRTTDSLSTIIDSHQ